MTQQDGPFRVTTTAIADARLARDAAEAELGVPVTVWARGDDHLVGYGVAARLAFTGRGRIAEAAAAWQALVDRATVEDGVHVPASGPVAFGSFAFADDSAAESVLVVPRRVIGLRDGRAFRTDVDGTGAETAAPPPAPASARTAFAPADYASAVDRAVERIREHDLQKVVLARDLVVETAGVDPVEVMRTLRDRWRDDAWVFAVDGLFGASPETLVVARRGAFTSRVLAGTAERAADPGADAAARDALLGSPKNRFEHALAVDSLLLTLGERVRDLALGRPFALGLPNVWHLATDATGRVSAGASVLDLVSALHPTAAVAGSPRETALALIAELEPFDRRRYAGPVGWIDASGDGEWAIALRCGEVEAPGRVRAYAGAGVVDGSQGDQELAETGWKFAPVLEALGVRPPG